MEDKTIRFCRAPSGLWVGWLMKDNAHYWGSGRTLDKLVQNCKNTLYQAHKGVSTHGYYLDSKPTPIDDMPVEIMNKSFQTRAWYGGRTKKAEALGGVNTQTTEPTKRAPRKQTVQEIDYDYYDHKFVDGELIIYGVVRKEVARYKLNPNRPQKPKFVTDLDVAQTPKPHLPPVTPFFGDVKTNGDDNGKPEWTMD